MPLPSRSVRMKSASFGGAKLEVEAMLPEATSNVPSRSGLQSKIKMLFMPNKRPDLPPPFVYFIKGLKQLSDVHLSPR